MIVIIDDDPTFMVLMCDLLQEEGYQVRCFATGTEAQTVIQQDQPALIILDMVMEQRDSGLTLLQMLRLHPTTKTIPILICSADGRFLKQKQEQLRKYHCDILEKPFTITEMLSKIRTNIYSQ